MAAAAADGVADVKKADGPSSVAAPATLVGDGNSLPFYFFRVSQFRLPKSTPLFCESRSNFRQL
jgi:hypothetical protein